MIRKTLVLSSGHRNNRVKDKMNKRQDHSYPCYDSTTERQRQDCNSSREGVSRVPAAASAALVRRRCPVVTTPLGGHLTFRYNNFTHFCRILRAGSLALLIYALAHSDSEPDGLVSPGGSNSRTSCRINTSFRILQLSRCLASYCTTHNFLFLLSLILVSFQT